MDSTVTWERKGNVAANNGMIAYMTTQYFFRSETAPSCRMASMSLSLNKRE